MRRAVTFFLLSVWAVVEAHATPEGEVRKAVTDLLAQPNFQWLRECEWTSPSDSPAPTKPSTLTTVTKGKTERNGFTVATMEITSPEYIARVPDPYRRLKGVFGGAKAVVEFGGGWISAAEFPAAFAAGQRLAEGKEKTGVLSALMWAAPFVQSGEAMPGATLRAILDECTSVIAIGRTFSLGLSPAGESQMLNMARQHTNWNTSGPVNAVSRCSVRCWVTDGQLTKLEVHVVGKLDSARNDMLVLRRKKSPLPDEESRNLDYTVIIVFSEVGKAELSLSEEVRDKLRQLGN